MGPLRPTFRENTAMMYHIPDVLSTDQVAEFTRQLAQAEWVDGRVTVGSQGRPSNRTSRSIPERRCMPACRPLCSICCAAIRSFFRRAAADDFRAVV